MAGRGRRLGGYAEKAVPLRRPGEIAVPLSNLKEISTEALIKKISDISVTNIDPVLLHETEILFKQLCVTGESVKDVILNLHSEALNQASFGEKLVLTLEQVATLEIDNKCVRSELLNFIESDFRMKELMCQTDKKKFVNAVMLLGGVYNVIKIQGVPIKILGLALLEYIDLLLQGDEEQLRIVAMQLIINGEKILMTDNLLQKYELLKHSLRKTLSERDLNKRSRCWLLLALDFTTNHMKPLNGAIRDFYVETLGEDYLNLESKIEVSSPSSKSTKSESSISSIGSSHQVSPPKKNEIKHEKSNRNEELVQKVHKLNIKSDGEGGKTSSGRTNRTPSKTPKSASSSRVKFDDGKQKMESKTLNSDKNSLLKSVNVNENEEVLYGLQIQRKKNSEKAEELSEVSAKGEETAKGPPQDS